MLCWTGGQTLADEKLFLVTARGYIIKNIANEERKNLISWENLVNPPFIKMIYI